MRQLKLTFLFAVLLCMVGRHAYAHDISVPNDDGVTIYYNFINEGEELEVTKNSMFIRNEYRYYNSIVIPEEVTYRNKTYKVTSIGTEAFERCSELSSVTIPNSVTYIGEHAFEFCSSLTSLIIPDGVISIGDGAFYCSGLTSIAFPNSIVSIGNGAFQECNNILSLTIPSSITTIGKNSFDGCGNLLSLTIGNGVMFIDETAFNRCSNLTVIRVEKGNIVYDSRDDCNAIIETATNKLVRGCKNAIIPKTVKELGNYAFAGSTELTSVDIPNSITSIGNHAFYNCIGLTFISIPNSVTSISDYAFAGCQSLTSIDIPNSVTSIGSYAFQGCKGLTSVDIPNSVTSIGSYAFQGCKGLSSIMIGKGVTQIGAYAFDKCNNLKAVNIKDLAAWCNISFINGSLVGLDNASNPLFYAHHLYVNGEEVKNLIIPDGVPSIGQLAFYKCNSLSSVTIPNSVSSIGNDAFADCDGLSSVHIKDIAAWCKISFENNPLSYAGHLYFNNEEVYDLVIPDGVTSISPWAFNGCPSLTSVNIPNSVTSIGNYAFSGCRGLTSVTMGNSIKEINKGAFSFCSDLTSVNIPSSVTSIGSESFSGCSALTSVTIPNSVTSIGSESFSGCSGLTSVTIGSGTKSMEVGAFSGADISSVISLIEEPFDIAGTSSEDYSQTFSNKTFVLGTLYVPLGTKEKYKTAKGWQDFMNIVEGLPQYTISYIIDDNLYKSYQIQVGASIVPEPIPMKEGYTFSGWSEIPSTMPANDVTITGSFTYIDAIEDVIAEDGNFQIYTLDGTLIDTLQKGVNVIRMKDGTVKKIFVK